MILLVKIRKVQKEPQFRVWAVSSPAKFSPPGEAKKSHMGGFQPRLATLLTSDEFRAQRTKPWRARRGFRKKVDAKIFFILIGK